jgi:hypothetical protein
MVLALCGVVGINVADRASESAAEYDRMRNFLARARSILETNKERFIKYYKLAVRLWMQETYIDSNDAEVRQNMYRQSKGVNFTLAYKKLCMDADLAASDQIE